MRERGVLRLSLGVRTKIWCFLCGSGWVICLPGSLASWWFLVRHPYRQTWHCACAGAAGELVDVFVREFATLRVKGMLL